MVVQIGRYEPLITWLLVQNSRVLVIWKLFLYISTKTDLLA